MVERNTELNERVGEIKSTLKTILSVQHWRFPASREVSSKEVHERLVKFFSEQLNEMGYGGEADQIIQDSKDNPTYIPLTAKELFEFRK